MLLSPEMFLTRFKADKHNNLFEQPGPKLFFFLMEKCQIVEEIHNKTLLLTKSGHKIVPRNPVLARLKYRHKKRCNSRHISKQ